MLHYNRFYSLRNILNNKCSEVPTFLSILGLHITEIQTCCTLEESQKLSTEEDFWF